MGEDTGGKQGSEGAEWIGIGLAIGGGVGVALGTAFDNLMAGLAFGPGLGMLIGVIIMNVKRSNGNDDDASGDAV